MTLPSTRLRTWFNVLVAVTAVLSVACAARASSPSSAAGISTTMWPQRIVLVKVSGMGFVPNRIVVQKGTELRLLIDNPTKVRHEAALGDDAYQRARESRLNGDQTGDEGSGGMASQLLPGSSGELSKTFDRAETLILGCHEPGHYAAGMRAAIVVA